MTLLRTQGKPKPKIACRVEGESELVQTAPIIVFEGILSLYDARIRDLMDIKIFVLTDDDIRLARRLLRDCSERGRTVPGVLQ
jgi:uridine kinase